MPFSALHYVELGLLAASMVIVAFAYAQMALHLRRYPRVDSTEALEAFKSMARAHMYLVLPILVFGLTPALLMRLEQAGAPPLQRKLMFAGYTLTIAMGCIGMWLERKVQNPNRPTEEMKRDFLFIRRMWKKTLFPKF